MFEWVSRRRRREDEGGGKRACFIHDAGAVRGGLIPSAGMNEFAGAVRGGLIHSAEESLRESYRVLDPAAFCIKPYALSCLGTALPSVQIQLLGWSV